MSSDDQSPRDRGRGLRANSTEEERKLWNRLRAKRFKDFKFRRQHPIGPYFADFCCVARRLVIELDGSQHAEPDVQRQDITRTTYLSGRGYRVMRFWNDQVKNEIDEVLQAIYDALTNS